MHELQFRNEILHHRSQVLGIGLEFLRRHEGVRREIDGSPEPLFVAGEGSAAYEAPGDLGYDLGEGVGDGDRGPGFAGREDGGEGERDFGGHAGENGACRILMNEVEGGIEIEGIPSCPLREARMTNGWRCHRLPIVVYSPSNI